MKSIYILIILFLTTITVCSQTKESIEEINSSSILEAKRVKFDPGRDAEKDITDAMQLADSLNKRILLDIGGEWCIWCHRLDYFFITNEDINKLLHNNFIVVKVNFSEANQNEKVLSAYPPAEGYPHFFILDNDGNLLHSQNTGELESGKGYSREKIIEFLNKWKITQNIN